LRQQFPNEPLKIVGNKRDLVEEQELETILKSLPVSCDFVTSAKTGESVDDMFYELGTEILS